jgi:hypothetical protein
MVGRPPITGRHLIERHALIYAARKHHLPMAICDDFAMGCH